MPKFKTMADFNKFLDQKFEAGKPKTPDIIGKFRQIVAGKQKRVR